MAKADYERALLQAKVELDEALRRRAEADRQIMLLKQTIEALTPLCDSAETDGGTTPSDSTSVEPLGVTQGIRRLLAETTVPLSALQLRDGLVQRGVNLEDYANAMAVIHNTLKRLTRQGEVLQVPSASGQVHYFPATGEEDTVAEDLALVMRATVAMHP